jgi:hypothetical protein
MDKIDTQGMSLPGKSKRPSSYEPMPVKIRTIFTPEEREELKQIFNEVLDARERPDPVELKNDTFAKDLKELFE